MNYYVDACVLYNGSVLLIFFSNGERLRKSVKQKSCLTTSYACLGSAKYAVRVKPKHVVSEKNEKRTLNEKLG